MNMKSHEIHAVIERLGQEDQKTILSQLLRMVETLSLATLELAGTIKQDTGKDPLSYGPRVILSEFLD